MMTGKAPGSSDVSSYKGARTRVRVDSELSEEFEAKAGMHQRYVLSILYFLKWL